MPEIALTTRPALATPALRSPDGSIVLEPLQEGRLVHALMPTGCGAADAVRRLTPIVGGAPHAVRPYSPGQWFVVSDVPLAAGELRRLRETIGADVALSDQSHGRVRIALRGAGARRLLAKGTAIDLAETVFPVGRSAQTLFGHVGIHVTRVASDRFELIVLRSFAEDLWVDLLRQVPLLDN